MLDLAIADDINSKAETVVLTNHGRTLSAPDWPQDSDFQIVAFSPNAVTCKIVSAGQLSGDIALALEALDNGRKTTGGRPDWYRRLARYARGASSA
ncbi:MAG TPA: hypothetical protein VMR33_08335 [Candidatus Baltobacteraceae bacterium]|jgi:hypothetical protein|nr:hypothetical protein [Candidatus Baltobacteraceae bacterium]